MEQNYVTVILRIKLKNIAYKKTSSQKKTSKFLCYEFGLAYLWIRQYCAGIQMSSLTRI